MNNESAISMAVTHLNVPMGSVVTCEELKESLKRGSTVGATTSPLSAALISTIFVEVSPSLIMRCAREAEASFLSLKHLYEEALAGSFPRSRKWEQAIEHLL